MSQSIIKPSRPSATNPTETPPSLVEKEHTQPSSSQLLESLWNCSNSKQITELLSKTALYEQQNNTSSTFHFKGLKNSGNSCFLNVILQSLFACPSFSQFLNFISKTYSESDLSQSPLLESILSLFKLCTVSTAINTSINTSTNTGTKTSSLSQNKKNTAYAIYENICKLKKISYLNQNHEDAQEYLGFLLDELHNEMLLRKPQTSSCPQDSSPTSNNDDEWIEIGKKNKVSLTRTTSQASSPFSKLFSGQYKSTVSNPGTKDSITYEPFIFLPLDIKNSYTLHEALLATFSLENLGLFSDSSRHSSQRRRSTQRKVLVQELPQILIFHLKRFVYSASHGVRKLAQTLDFPPSFNFPKQLLSSVAQSKTPAYELRSVIDHHGSSPESGHYTCHVRALGSSNTWFHIDDELVLLSKENTSKASAHSCSYLLFYELV